MPTVDAAAKQGPGPDDWLTRREAAAYAKVSVDTIDRAIKGGRLKASRPVPHRVVIRRRWVDAFLALASLVTKLVLLGLIILGLLTLACNLGFIGLDSIADAMPVSHWHWGHCGGGSHHHHTLGRPV